MRIVVTGAYGFVGLNVARHLAAEHDIIAVGRTDPDEWVTRFFNPVAGRVVYRRADLAVSGALADVLARETADVVVHAAAVTATTLAVEREEASRIVVVNTSGTIEALDLARQLGARRFVYVSSPAAIGLTANDVVLDESVETRPQNIYGITKQSSELLTRRYGELHDLSTVSVRIAQPYGPGERATPSRPRTSPIYEWLEAAHRGDKLVTGPLEMARDWTWIEETAAGIGQLATAHSLGHDLYHLSASRLFSVGDVIDALRLEFPALEVDDRLELPDINPNIANQTRRVLDTSRFRDEFGWAPSVPIGEGMARYLEWRRSW